MIRDKERNKELESKGKELEEQGKKVTELEGKLEQETGDKTELDKQLAAAKEAQKELVDELAKLRATGPVKMITSAIAQLGRS